MQAPTKSAGSGSGADQRPPWWRSRAARWSGRVLRCYVLLVLLMMLLERRFVFFPTAQGDWNPKWLQFEEAHFQAEDGTRLHGWYLEHPRPRAVVLFAHGNAGNLTHRIDIVEQLRWRLHVSVMIFDYRGYGKSRGSPTEQGILQDARAARAWLARRANVAEQEIVLLGRSLGGGVMVDLAARDGARALVLDSTFTSLPDVGAWHYPWLPVRWLMRTRLDSLSKIGQYRGPLLQFHGDADRIVPYELGRRLFQAAPGPRKRFVTLAGHDHNDPLPDRFYRELERFLKDLPPAEMPRE